MSRNPYIVDGQEPTLRKSVFVFMDMLGYSALIDKSQKDGAQQTTLRDLHSTLSESRRGLEDRDYPVELRELGDKDHFAIKAFTDNIAIGWPVFSDAEIEFDRAFSRLAAFQLKMAIKGYFVRGAIAVGSVYVDEVVVFGETLIQACEGEKKLARDPRIILTDSAMKVAKQHLTNYSNNSYTPHVRDILKDADGQWFLNYLDTVLIAADERGPFYYEFIQHKVAVEKKLAEQVGNPEIWSKYAWVAGYHNYFCDLNSKYFGDEHRVDIDLYRATPSLIVDGAQ